MIMPEITTEEGEQKIKKKRYVWRDFFFLCVSRNPALPIHHRHGTWNAVPTACMNVKLIWWLVQMRSQMDFWLDLMRYVGLLVMRLPHFSRTRRGTEDRPGFISVAWWYTNTGHSLNVCICQSLIWPLVAFHIRHQLIWNAKPKLLRVITCKQVCRVWVIKIALYAHAFGCWRTWSLRMHFRELFSFDGLLTTHTNI